ncbi:hypothetical protein [Actinoplanes sp. NPDC049265]|uniref:hypothetical protein n=1 Tax=Actinoplanes sp. NPDC049265 TaxID=3363902 RepID=UPI00370FD663
MSKKSQPDDYLVNAGDPGTGLVDLNVNWEKPRDITGNGRQLTTWVAPHEDSPGHYSYTDQLGRVTIVDADGDPFPAARNPSDNSVPPDPPPPSVGNFKVNTGTMYECESAVLAEVKHQITEFEAFKDARLAREPWIFFKESADAKTKNVPISKNLTIVYSQKDPHPDQTAEVMQSQNALLQTVGGVIQLVSQYISKVNDAAQTYASADRKSWID